MGFGLIIAVLGLGSTFAASININGGQDTEFGQGSTRTVYCGDSADDPTVITVTPFSTYVNTVLAAPADSFITRFATSYLPDFFEETDTTPLPSTVNGITGWWAFFGGEKNLKPNQSLADAKLKGVNSVFIARTVKDGKNGYYKADKSVEGEVVITPAVEAIPATFRMAGVLISDIPEECDDVVFVLSFFGETGTAQTMISGQGEVVKEVAYSWYYNSTPGTAYAVSSSRTSFVPTSLVTADTTVDSLKFIFNSVGATAIEADDLDKIIVETQADSFD
jgi:hypothetical protein